MLTATRLAAAGTEHAHQVALFAYCAIARRYGWDIAEQWDAGTWTPSPVGTGEAEWVDAIPELEWFHAIPNGGSRGDSKASAMRRGADLKAEGVRSGVSDTCLPVKRGQWSGLYLELKKPGGQVRKEQRAFGEFVKSQGFGFAVCYGWRQAVDMLRMYLSWHDP